MLSGLEGDYEEVRGMEPKHYPKVKRCCHYQSTKRYLHAIRFSDKDGKAPVIGKVTTELRKVRFKESESGE
ncbi:hypothetical protein V6N11_039610 [Hibiscus sabdariffa]|uniref:Uncharacterized protein n=1 Tax=Hibiscus sabdariffa TaxID=183260 RepID=A0ABR2SND0_9ROSI